MLKHIGARVDDSWFVQTGWLVEPTNAISHEIDRTEARNIVNTIHYQSRLRTSLRVLVKQRCNVEVKQRVTVQYEKPVSIDLSCLHRIDDGTAAAELLGFSNRGEREAIIAPSSHKLLYLVAQVAGGQGDVVDTVRSEPIELVSQKRATPHGGQRFRPVGDAGAQARAKATAEDQRRDHASGFVIGVEPAQHNIADARDIRLRQVRCRRQMQRA